MQGYSHHVKEMRKLDGVVEADETQVWEKQEDVILNCLELGRGKKIVEDEKRCDQLSSFLGGSGRKTRETRSL